MTENGREDATRRRLLEAAGEIFACKGYQAATVREITKLAKANLAAIHYHFGSKDRLYQAVLEHAYREANRRYPLEMGLAPGACPQERLYAFVRALLLRLREQAQNPWLARLMAREMAEPSPNLSQLVQRCLAAANAVLTEIVAALLPVGTDSRTVARCAQSIVGQCRYFILDGPLVSRLSPGRDEDQGALDALALHITRFSLAGLGCPEALTFVPPCLDFSGDAL